MLKKTLIGLWISLLIFCLSLYFIHPEWFEVTNLTLFFQKFKNHILFSYIVISLLRGIVLLPSTPFVLAGVILFPQECWLVFFISVCCILASSTAIYYFSDYMGLDKMFGAKYAARKAHIQSKINSPYGVGFITAWAFFPFAPTDLICYVAGVARMHFGKFILGILLGEGIICALYIFTGGKVFSLFLASLH
jgi:uncharacterized membrane protein YdjX (TVP38/TMEM64 family)